LQVRVQVCFRYTCRASYGVLFGLQLDADCDVFAGRSQNVSVAVSSWVAWLMAGALKKTVFLFTLLHRAFSPPAAVAKVLKKNTLCILRVKKVP
jgi:hypothetical protein